MVPALDFAPGLSVLPEGLTFRKLRFLKDPHDTSYPKNQNYFERKYTYSFVVPGWVCECFWKTSCQSAYFPKDIVLPPNLKNLFWHQWIRLLPHFVFRFEYVVMQKFYTHVSSSHRCPEIIVIVGSLNRNEVNKKLTYMNLLR